MKEKKRMRKSTKVLISIIGVVIIGFGGLVGFKAIEMQQNGMNIFTGQMTGEAQAKVENNSSAQDFEYDGADMFSVRDLKQVPDLVGATTLSLLDGKDVVVTEQGVYVVSGSYEDIMIVVEAGDEAKVQLVFDGFTVTNEDKPAVYVKSADKVFVTTTDTVNSLIVTGKYQAEIGRAHV